MQERDGSIIAPSAADRLIAAHDGDVALLYIYITRTGCTDMERAAGDLCRTMQEISSAEEKLRRMGLLSAAGAKRPAPAEGLPQYTAADLTRRSQEDPGFSIILAEARNVMGRTLSSNDMRILFGIYDYLALPTDVILTLLHYCGGVHPPRKGKGGARLPAQDPARHTPGPQSYRAQVYKRVGGDGL